MDGPTTGLLELLWAAKKNIFDNGERTLDNGNQTVHRKTGIGHKKQTLDNIKPSFGNEKKNMEGPLITDPLLTSFTNFSKKRRKQD